MGWLWTGFLPCFSQAPCDLNLRSVSSLDIVIPGLNSSTDVQARINAGESIHIIRGTKGETDCPPSPSGLGRRIRACGEARGSDISRSSAVWAGPRGSVPGLREGS